MDFDSGVSSLYVSDLFPKMGDFITLRLFVKDAKNIKKVSVNTVVNDICTLTEAHLNGSFYEAKVCFSSQRLKWWFEIQVQKETYVEVLYYTKNQIQTEVPLFHEAFELVSYEKNPKWVASSTCYQIFPDRFMNADPSVGVHDNEYSFDHGQAKVMAWGERPLRFEEGRCLDFFNGDLKGIEEAIPYFKKLGISCLYINPIGLSKTTHRYDCEDYFEIDPKLGGEEALISLIEACHANDIRVVVDISINHTSIESTWIKQKRDDFYYKKADGSYECWQGVPTLAQLNYNSQELRSLVYSAMKKFIRPPFNQDGWRLDVADVVGVYENEYLTKEIWNEVNSNLKQEKEDLYLVAEAWRDPSAFFDAKSWDAVMNYQGCSRVLRRWAGEMDRFQLAAWGHNLEETRPYTGVELQRTLERQLNSFPGQFMYFQMNLLDSHDTVRFHNHIQIYDESVYLGLISLMYMLPGMPCTYYGDEILLEGFVGSMEDSRFCMDWNPKRQDCKVFEHYQRLGKLREEYKDVLSFGSFRFFDAQENSVAFARYNDSRALILILNRNNEPKSFKLDYFPNSERFFNAFTKDPLSSTVELESKTSLLVVCDNPFG